jgi:hypothetical protein
MDANLGTGTALHIGTEKRLKDKHISPIQEALHTPKRSLTEIQRGCLL